MAKKSLFIALLMLVGCAHVRLSGSDLDRVVKPAFVSRIEDGAGPKARVFREDSSFNEKLKRLDSKEADRRLQVKLAQTSRFEVSERLRAVTFASLPHERPWSNTVSGATVAKALESFLVEEVPANAPDFELLKPYGVDAVVEFVVEDYGLRSEEGKAGAYAKGYGRMFFLDGGEIWRKGFDEDQVRDHTAALDPFAVGKDPLLFRAELAKLLDKVSKDFAQELNPTDRVGARSLRPGSSELDGKPDSTHKTGRENEIDNGTDLPAPDAKPATQLKRNGTDDEDRPATAPGMQAPTEVPVDKKK